MRPARNKKNGQNFPRDKTAPVKQVFYPRFDKIVNADLSQLEWRVAAFLAQDQVAMEEIRSGLDSHMDNALKFFGGPEFRTDAKIFLFRMIQLGSLGK